MTTAAVKISSERRRTILEKLRTVESNLRYGLALAKDQIGAILAGLAANIQRAREIIARWVREGQLLEWQRDIEIMGHRQKLLGRIPSAVAVT